MERRARVVKYPWGTWEGTGDGIGRDATPQWRICDNMCVQVGAGTIKVSPDYLYRNICQMILPTLVFNYLQTRALTDSGTTRTDS
jgi:hypothetical protein